MGAPPPLLADLRGDGGAARRSGPFW